MSKLVDIETIRKEVDSIKSIHIAECRPGDIDTFAKGICSGMLAIEDFLDALPEEKPVDLEEDFFFDEILSFYDSHNWLPPKNSEIIEVLEAMAEHFFNLGRMAKKD